jgi:hypothetical protein
MERGNKACTAASRSASRAPAGTRNPNPKGPNRLNAASEPRAAAHCAAIFGTAAPTMCRTATTGDEASATCTETGLTPATSAPGLASPLPHLHQDWAHRCHICTGTGLSRCAVQPLRGCPLRVQPMSTRRAPLLGAVGSDTLPCTQASIPLCSVRHSGMYCCCTSTTVPHHRAAPTA